jgi:hypothetical protein
MFFFIYDPIVNSITHPEIFNQFSQWDDPLGDTDFCSKKVMEASQNCGI